MNKRTLELSLELLTREQESLTQEVEQAIQAHKYGPLLELNERLYEVADAIQELTLELGNAYT